MKKVIIIVLLSMMFVLSGCSTSKNYGSTTYTNSIGVSATKTCGFTDNNGRKTCSNPAIAGGSLCSTHFNYLNDIYSSFADALAD